MELSTSQFYAGCLWHVSGGPCGLQFCFKEGFDRGPSGMSVRKTHNLSPRFLINRYKEPSMLNLHRLVMLDNSALKMKYLGSPHCKSGMTARPPVLLIATSKQYSKKLFLCCNIFIHFLVWC